MSLAVRPAALDDIPRLVYLSEQMRLQYQSYQPVFWRKAADSAERQTEFFRGHLIERDTVALVAEQEGQIAGFLIGMIRPAPPVYDPGGLTCIVDDFAVARPDLWPAVGQHLLETLTARGMDRGVVQIVVVCGHRDEAKRAFLKAMGYPVASEWRVRTIS